MKSFVIVPEKVKGHGNLVASNTVDRYSMSYKCTVSDEFKLVADSGTETVISISVSSSSVSYGTSFTVSGVLKTASNTPLASKSVKLYADGTLLDTLTTNSSGAYSKTISNAFVGSHSYYAVFEADSTYAGVTSSTVSVTVSKITSTLSLSAPASVIVGSAVNLSGTLSVGSGNAVKIYRGGVLIDTVTTGTGGAYSYSDTGLSIGNYSYYAVYDGDETHSNVTSSTVNVSVSSKPTPSLTLTGSSSITYGDSLTVGGVLSYNNTLISNASIKLYDGTTYIDTVTTNQQGVYSKTVTGLNVGNHTIKSVFEGNSTYANVEATLSVTVTEVPAPVATTLTLTADKSILSYADSESATLSATLLDQNDDPMANKSVSFFKVVGESEVQIGNATTNSNGVATMTYASAGVGDVEFYTTFGSLVSETCSLQDLHKYDSGATDQTSKYSTMNANSFVHSTDHYELVRTLSASDTSRYYTVAYLTDYNLPTDYELSVDFLTTDYYNQDELNIVSAPIGTYQNGNEFGIISTGVRYGLLNRVNGTGSFYTTDGHLNSNTWYTFIIKVEGTTVTATIKNGATTVFTNSQTISNASSFKKFSMVCGNNAHTIKFKNLKVKPL